MPERSVEEILAATSEILFPSEGGKARVTLKSRDSDGDSPRHVLAWQNDVEGVRLLIDAGADVNAIGDMGCMPLHVAVAQRNQALIDLLVEAGAAAGYRQ